MSIRTTVTLDDDVAARVKLVSQAKGIPFRDALNELLRLGLLGMDTKHPARTLVINPRSMGYKSGLPHDNIEALLEYGEGQTHR